MFVPLYIRKIEIWLPGEQKFSLKREFNVPKGKFSFLKRMYPLRQLLCNLMDILPYNSNIRFMKNLFLLSISLLFALGLKAQGPIDGYMKAGGETDFALSYGYEHYEKYYLGNMLQDTFNRTYQSVNLFVAYGFEKNLGFVASIPFMWSDKENRGFQDGQFFIKYRALEKKMKKGRLDYMLAGGITTAISGYKVSPESSNPIGERPTIIEFRTLAQHHFNSGFFVMAKTGVSLKIRPNTQTAIPNLIRAGYAHSRFYTDFWLEGVFSIGAKANEVPLGQEGSTFIKFGGTFYYPIGKYFGAFINGAYTAWGRNIGISPRFGTGVVFKIPPRKIEDKK